MTRSSAAKFSRDAPAERFPVALGEALRYRVAAKLGRPCNSSCSRTRELALILFRASD